MANFYPYLISSLPMLHFGMKPPFSFEQFLALCRGSIPQDDFSVLSGLPRIETDVPDGSTDRRTSIIKKWLEFETMLRNELTKIRAGRKHIEAQKYLRPGDYSEPEILRVTLSACRNPSILEAENILDQSRWHSLDNLALGHYFDLDYLIVYAYKLLILERWETVRVADKSALLEKTLST